MQVLTRDQFLSRDDRSVHEFVSEVWGGIIKYRRALVGDRATARRRAQVAKADGTGTETDYDRFGAAVVVACSVEPKFEPQDVEVLMERNASEVERLVNAILGGAPKNPQ